ncbi:MAG: hypothetical protein A2087_12090 [Spirochaetes bacterium GWD1_61_31]|nr:MAG: hypothetical protein A2Y37_14420 [Spirochaetes bacterium GWB1_60_80]OHD28547.1 MAG: hypothetical protein A2004_02780 [Spirochaetes bacterium GWC1_61_12]OHD42640.1 MAG: hypothetical protein A2087_12090 [Spirochaetes bacterium GWD1_61_31]OHD44541.1 MAG: hypothetical protein A2Y35_05260 [Spirochaetes bacterium GWE1_60_18]OHD58671.1 MAG: hypothetical protein A2Y32_03355 [Spirochaetes bacterium GWF1_60_12]HAP43196.1 hypothetical protein [Spirochaetaceae bacterium]
MPAISHLAASDTSSLTELTAAAFLLSGHDSVSALAAERILEALLAEAALLAIAIQDPYQRGEAVMQLLHDKALKAYHEPTTTLSAALLEGRYNCVSASVLFLLLSRAAGLDSFGVITTDHSFCTVRLAPDRFVDAETTNRFGWDPGSHKEFADNQGGGVGYRYVPPGDYAERQTVPDRVLVGLIAQNRITLLERSQRWPEAFELMVDLHAWQSDAASLSSLADRAGNYAGSLANGRRWGQAAAFLAAFAAAYPTTAKLDGLLAMVRYGQLTEYLPGADLADGQAAIVAGHEAGWLEAADVDELIAYLYSRVAEATARDRQWQAAWELLQAGLARWPDNDRLVELERQAGQNWAYGVHNRFATLFNAGRYAEARAILESALTLAPANRLLQDDYAVAQRQAGQSQP